MFWTLNSITEVKEQFPTLFSLHDETTYHSRGNISDVDINWDYLYDRLRNQHFHEVPDYRIHYNERTDADVIDYGLWSESKIYIVSHKNIQRMLTMCSCIRSRAENEDPTPLLGRTAHHDHDEIHRLANALANMNENRQVPAGSWNNEGRVEQPYYLYKVAENLDKQFQQRFVNSTPFNKSIKHKYYRQHAQDVAASNIFYIFSIIQDENGVDRCFSMSYIIPYFEDGVTKLSHNIAYSLNEEATPFWGYYDTFKWDIFEQVIYKPSTRSSIRQYKECKICLSHVNKNNTVFAINMERNANRYSICFLCASTYTAGFDPNTNAFVRFPYGVGTEERATRNFLRSIMMDEDGDRTNEYYNQTLVPFWRRIPTTRNSSGYQWEDMTDYPADFLEDRGYGPRVQLSLEARKYLSWASQEDIFTPDEGAYESIGHIGNTFDWFSYSDMGEAESVQAWEILSDGGFQLFTNSETVDMDYDELEQGLVRSTGYTALFYDMDLPTHDDDGNNIYDYSMFLTIYDSSQFENYINDRYNGSANPAIRRVIRVSRTPLHVIRHGLPEMNLEKNTWDFTFPVWQVAHSTHDDGRLIKPVGQIAWTNTELMSNQQQMTFNHSMASRSPSLQSHIINSEMGPFFGMELEIVGRRNEHQDANDMENTHRKLIELFHPAWTEVQRSRVQLAYRVKDSSVDSGSAWGQEVVTQPMNLEAWQQVPDDFWQLLKDKYVAMYNEGGGRNFGNGIHIHIDHDAFTTGHLWAFIDYFMRQHDIYINGGQLASESTLLYKVAQRHSDRWAHWRMPYHERRRTVLSNTNDIIAATALRRRTDRGGDGKYDGFNLVKENTIELRYFNSTTVKDRVLARVEFVDAVYRMTKNLVASELPYYNTTEGEQNGLYREFFNDLTVSYWDDKLWFYILSTEGNRNRYQNLIKLGRETNSYDLSRLFADTTERGVVNDHLDTLELITEEGGTH